MKEQSAIKNVSVMITDLTEIKEFSFHQDGCLMNSPLESMQRFRRALQKGVDPCVGEVFYFHTEQLMETVTSCTQCGGSRRYENK